VPLLLHVSRLSVMRCNFSACAFASARNANSVHRGLQPPDALVESHNPSRLVVPCDAQLAMVLQFTLRQLAEFDGPRRT
jgi:hypothetical protein